tara:strand:- start:1193 stop:2911 length:1719 start_codon:yes stop_codon:yes gene_type:complete
VISSVLVPAKIFREYSKYIRLGFLLFFGIVGVVFRFYGLSHMPLLNRELVDANLGVMIVNGDMSSTNYLGVGSPITLFFHVILFWLTGSSSVVIVRFVSALFGSVLMFVPFMFERYVGRIVSYIMFSFIAVAPSAVMISRIADGSAIGFFGWNLALLGLARLFKEKQISGQLLLVYGLMIGVLSGRYLLVGGLIFIVFCYLSSQIELRQFSDYGLSLSSFNIIGLVIVTVIVCTKFLVYKQGMMSLGNVLIEWISGWGYVVEGKYWYSFILTAFRFQIPLILALLGGIWFRSPFDRIDKVIFGFMLMQLIYACVYGAISGSYMILLVIPLFVLIARMISTICEECIIKESVYVIGVQIILLFSLIIFGVIVFGDRLFLDVLLQSQTNNQVLVSLALLIGMLAMVVVLFGVGWSWSNSLSAFAITFTVVGVFYSMHVSSRFRRFPVDNILQSFVSYPSNQILVDTLGDISLRVVGIDNEVDIHILGDQHRLRLDWMLRDFKNITWSHDSDARGASVVIADGKNFVFGVDEPYVGHDFQLYNDNYSSNFVVASSSKDIVTVWVKEKLIKGSDNY